ncbi:tetratricopeptide repeat protein [Paenibacillus kyungheensis]|uniref:Tetratricopeptide repeat protein n=1 Tax=Paenibacillus kyungheensis TaxID=1452732 RepID=A0AAX3M1Q0_9BACL|nr:tetratricopeptide repeat protein [Paenibacillus kyungheensis]WCT56074.1 tetratricopeptide repeat protein [Paenibacillus kyungheensis]
MNDYKRKVGEDERKVISLHWDANFFFERAVRSLDRHRYDKALKYFEKAVEYEPNNPVNHCNMAGILSEIGNYEASNQVLANILDVVDPAMVECHFYMANNYANMSHFEQAEASLLTYLELDKDGQFLDEAGEMMELLHKELKRSSSTNHDTKLPVNDYDAAQSLLEQGQFVEAAEQFEQIIKVQPDLHTARNHLAIALYYQGKMTEAALQIEEVLMRDPHNLHGLCNQAILMQHLGQTEQVKQQIDVLTRIIPFQQEHLLKLATTLGMLGDHELAYTYFRKLIKQQESVHQWALYHYAATAACHLHKIDEARKLWSMILRFEPEAEVPSFYMEHVEQIKLGKLMPSYHYQLSFQPKSAAHARVNIENYMYAEPTHIQLLHILAHGNEQQQLRAIESYVLDDNEEVYQALRHLLQEPQISDRLRTEIKRVLRQSVNTQALSADYFRVDTESTVSNLSVLD